ncbi:MAG: 3'-5' exonuclease [Burkholderiales bacterium]|jgi:predicted PolB exonuclease-like 3'-5' exonuclease|nr:3'-5' exonuclease [Burkholderiales bacterium]
MIPVLVFDIETITDVCGIRRVHRLSDELNDTDVLDWYQQQRRAATGSDFAHLYFQQVVAIACVLRNDKGVQIWSLGEAHDTENELLRRFFEGIERFTPQLVSWNGGGFDLPVLHYRSMLHGVAAPRYWEWGDEDRDFKYNNYLNRYHTRHIDLMDVLAQYQARANAGLDAMARLCGFPGKLLMDGGDVGTAIAEGKIEDVRRYCECDTLNTYLLFLRFQLLRGIYTEGEYGREIETVRNKLQISDTPHWRAFLSEWDEIASR